MPPPVPQKVTLSLEVGLVLLTPQEVPTPAVQLAAPQQVVVHVPLAMTQALLLQSEKSVHIEPAGAPGGDSARQ
jgi:hypothetical protein